MVRLGETEAWGEYLERGREVVADDGQRHGEEDDPAENDEGTEELSTPRRLSKHEQVWK